MIPNPLALIAEVTHRCPLRCVYCSNPLQLVSKDSELTTADWKRVFQEASAIGVLHLHLTGGEPASRCRHLNSVPKSTLDGCYLGNRATRRSTSQSLMVSGKSRSSRKVRAADGGKA